MLEQGVCTLWAQEHHRATNSSQAAGWIASLNAFVSISIYQQFKKDHRMLIMFIIEVIL